MKKHRILLLVATIAIAILAVPVAVSASHQWGKYQWKSDAPVTLTLGNNVSSTWDAHLDGAIADWNASAVLDLSEVSGAVSNVANCVPATGNVEICNYNYGDNGWLGMAQIWISRGKNIAKANSRMNDYYFESVSYYSSDASNWRRYVMCQEVGHDFGLGHQDVDFNNTPLGTCMDYTGNPLTTADLSPNQHDYDQLVSMYGADDDDDGGKGGGPPAGKGKKGAGKPSFAPLSGGNSEFGRAIGFDASGRANEFERDLGVGNKLITHVLWAN